MKVIEKLLEYKNKSKKMLEEGWISIKKPPIESMKVRWICKDGNEDLGYYYADTKTFGSFDLSSEERITHWKPFEFKQQ